MKKLPKNHYIIGIDHGFGNIKIANHCFPMNVKKYDTEPLFSRNALLFGNNYYLIGEGHKAYQPNKVVDEDYYIATLAAIAEELTDANVSAATVLIAAGLPLTWTGVQKKEFAAYLMQNKDVTFFYRKRMFEIHINGVRIYPQGYAAIAESAPKMQGINLIADIGNGTMNTLYVINGRPQNDRTATERFGTHQCMLAVRERYEKETKGRILHESVIEEIFRRGTADLPDEDMEIVAAAIREYVSGIFERLRDHGYDEKSMRLVITGGGGCLVKNFGTYNKNRVSFVEDICAAAKGYEFLAEYQANHGMLL